jgi:hypothetical protein
MIRRHRHGHSPQAANYFDLTLWPALGCMSAGEIDGKWVQSIGLPRRI